MNTNFRIQLANILKQDDPKNRRESLKNDSQRMFGRELTNNSLILKEARKVQSKSINPVKETKQLPEIRTKESIVLPSKRSFMFNEEPKQNAQHVPEYADQIYEFLIKKENSEIVLDDKYMKNQKEINEKMRATLIDWIIDVHLKFGLLQETLFMTSKIIDKYLEKTEITKKKLQLLGIAALFISCKYQQIYPPSPKAFVQLSQKTYGFSEIVEMEGKILKQFNFNLTFNTPSVFLERLIMLYKIAEKQANLCRYLLELTMLETKMLKFSPQVLAAAAVFLMTFVSKNAIKQNYELISESEVKICAKEICFIFQGIPKSSYQGSRKKYSTANYNEVSKIMLHQQTNNQL